MAIDGSVSGQSNFDALLGGMSIPENAEFQDKANAQSNKCDVRKEQSQIIRNCVMKNFEECLVSLSKCFCRYVPHLVEVAKTNSMEYSYKSEVGVGSERINENHFNSANWESSWYYFNPIGKTSNFTTDELIDFHDTIAGFVVFLHSFRAHKVSDRDKEREIEIEYI